MKIKKTFGFTLVELLVVISVIALLAAMLLPALSGAMTTARRARCVNSLEQVYRAFKSYGLLFNNELPNLFVDCPTDAAAQKTAYWDATGIQSAPSINPGVPKGLWLLCSTKVLPEKDTLWCPNMPGSLKFDGGKNKATDGVPRSVGYAYNYFPEQLDPDSQKAWVPDGFSWDEAQLVGNDPSQRSLSRFGALASDTFLTSDFIHKGGLNVCYIDGSVQWYYGGPLRWDDSKTAAPALTFSNSDSGCRAVANSWALVSKFRR